MKSRKAAEYVNGGDVDGEKIGGEKRRKREKKDEGDIGGISDPGCRRDDER